MDIQNAFMKLLKHNFRHIEFNENESFDKMKEQIVMSGNYGRFITFDKFEKWFNENTLYADQLLNRNYNGGS